MVQDMKKVFVTGATGRQGSALIQALLGKGFTIRALTRKEGLVAHQLQDEGVEIAFGDFNEPASIMRAAEGMEVAFAMSTPYEKGPEAEIVQGLNLVDALKLAGVQRLIYTSVAGANHHTGVPHFDSKMRIEEHIKSSGIPYTIIAPVFFMENFLGYRWLPALEEGKLPMALPPNRKLQQIAVSDIGRFGAYVIEHLEEFVGQRIDIASDELTGTRVADILSRVSGRKIKYVQVPLDQLYAQDEESGKMFEWFEKKGYSADIPLLREKYPEVGWHTFEQWAEEKDWSVLRQHAGVR